MFCNPAAHSELLDAARALVKNQQIEEGWNIAEAHLLQDCVHERLTHHWYTILLLNYQLLLESETSFHQYSFENSSWNSVMQNNISGNQLFLPRWISWSPGLTRSNSCRSFWSSTAVRGHPKKTQGYYYCCWRNNRIKWERLWCTRLLTRSFNWISHAFLLTAFRQQKLLPNAWNLQDKVCWKFH